VEKRDPAPVHLFVERALLDRLDALAKRERRNRADQIRHLIEVATRTGEAA
jgi:predicted DNA-binding protein